MNEKDMMERYIYEVTKRVSQKARKEIKLELQTLIEDMCEEEEMTMEEALQKLGNPAEFAKRYKDGPDYLIGPDYYNHYIWVVKIALISVGISSLISAIVQGMMDVGNWTNFFVKFFTELFIAATNGACSMIGIVTIIFAILEWQNIKVSLKTEADWTVDKLSKNPDLKKSWNPNLLPPIPDKRKIISRGDSIVSIIFITVFAMLLLFAPQIFGVFRYDGNEVKSISCIFNLEEWNKIVPLLVFWLFIGMLDEIIRLVNGCYCKVVMYSSIICNSIQIVGAVLLLKIFPLWNPDFAEQIKEFAGIHQFSTGDILYYWGSGFLDNIILLGICIISCVETGITIYKTLR